MRKEIAIVIIVGTIIGAVIAYGIYVARSAVKEKTTSSETENSEQQSSFVPSEESHILAISSPENDSISSEENITVSGTTSPKAIITIIAPENEYLLTADENGAFSAEIALVGGANTVSISSFSENGNKAEQTITVVYSTAEL